MNKILVTGAGKIGSLIACMLLESGDYEVHLADIQFDGEDITQLKQFLPSLHTVIIDVRDKKAMHAHLKKEKYHGIISCLPYYCNVEIAEYAKEFKLHYFDLTEDVQVTDAVRGLAEGASTAFVPQCGLAPGFIGIAANSIMKKFDSLDKVKLRVGALPTNTSNVLQYSLTWSTDGLINEYGNACLGIKNGKQVELQPLESLEQIQFDGQSYEAFNTSGGLGSLAELYLGRVNNLTYKTMRYPGHCKKMRLLMNDLKLNEDRTTFKRILENAVPRTNQDVVLVYVSVTGLKGGQLSEENYMNKIYPQELAGITWSAIQITTASGLCAAVEQVFAAPDQYKGFTYQEQFELETLLENRFGKHYRLAS